MVKKMNANSILMGKPEGKRPPRRHRHRHRWEDNIKVDLREKDLDDKEWIDRALDRDQWRIPVNTVMNFRVP
jgi:hypothetical protein